MKIGFAGFATKRLDVQQAAHGCQVASSWCPRWASLPEAWKQFRSFKELICPKICQVDPRSWLPTKWPKRRLQVGHRLRRMILSYLVQSSPEISKSKDSVKHWNYTALTFFVMPHVRMICPLPIVLLKNIHLILQTTAFSLRTSAPSSSHESNGRSQASFSFEKCGGKFSKAI